MSSEKIRGIYKRGKTFWFAHQKRGRRVFISLETNDYVKAVEKAAEIIRLPELNPTQGIKADVEHFVAHQMNHQVWTKSTKDSKGAVLDKFVRWIGARSTDQISSDDLAKWYEELRSGNKRNGQRLHEGSAQTYMMVLRTFFNWAKGENLVRENPVEGVELARVTHAPRRRFCSFEQRDAIINGTTDNDLLFVFYCGFHAGLRKQEIIEARPEWFDLGRGLIHVCRSETFMPKDKEDRTIPLTSAFKAFLSTYGVRSPFMLRPEVKHGRSMYRYDFDAPYFRYLTPLGFRWVTAHVMRHTFGSLLASAGCSIYKIALWLGDEVVTAQKHYAHLLPVDADIELGVSPRSNRTTHS